VSRRPSIKITNIMSKGQRITGS